MFLDLFEEKKPILAMLHLKGRDIREKTEICIREAAIYKRCGIDGMIIEDYFARKDDVVKCLDAVSQEDDYTLGVNVLDNFSFSWELAMLKGAKFIQVDSVAGHLPLKLDKAYETMISAYRQTGNIQVIGGVRFKYQPVLSGRSIEEDIRLGMQRCDAIACTGEGTGLDTSEEKLVRFRNLMGDFPLIVAAGVTKDSLAAKLSIADAAIVGSYFKEGHVDTGDVSEDNVKAFMENIYKFRETLG